jgi:hypothetical protein
MNQNIIEIFGKIAGVGGLGLATFLIVAKTVLKKDIFPRLTRKDAERLLRIIIIFSFLLGALGLSAWLLITIRSQDSGSKIVQTLVDEGFDIQIVEGKVTASKRTGKIIASVRGSCIGPESNPMFRKSEIWNEETQQYEAHEHKQHVIYLDVLNLFDHPVAITEHRVVSMVDGDYITGYRLNPVLRSVSPGESREFIVESIFDVTSRAEAHLKYFDPDKTGPMFGIQIFTSEGVLPVIPVDSISGSDIPCLTEDEIDSLTGNSTPKDTPTIDIKKYKPGEVIFFHDSKTNLHRKGVNCSELPDEVMCEIARARRRIHIGDLNGAKKALNSLGGIRLIDKNLYGEIGLLWYMIGEDKQSEKAYRNAIKYDNKNSTLHNNLAFLLFDLDRLKEAIDEWNLSLKYNPLNTDALAGQAIAFFALGKIKEAEFSYRKAVEKDRSYLDCQHLKKANFWSEKACATATPLIETIKKRP